MTVHIHALSRRHLVKDWFFISASIRFAGFEFNIHRAEDAVPFELYMTARFLNQNAFEFEISHKLGAIRGRLHCIPFDMKWNRPGESDRDPSLPDGDHLLSGTLRAEAEGILAWLVAGAVAYERDKLLPPPEVVNMTRSYFSEQDGLGSWLSLYEHCDPQNGEPAHTLFDTFSTWCEEEGIGNAYKTKSFAQSLQSRNVANKKTAAGRFYGIRLKGDLC